MARKTKEEALRTKQQLLDSAMDIMSERAYSNISMTEIAERIGYSKGAVYWHFRNKHDILINIIDASCSRTGGQMSTLMGEQHSLDGLREYFKNKLRLGVKDKRARMFHRLLNRAQEWPEDVRGKVTNILVDRINKEREMIEKMLTNMQDSGKIKKDVDARETAGLISAIFHGMFLFQVEDIFYRMDFSKHIDMLFGAFEKELTTRK